MPTSFARHWPPFALRLRIDDLELRLPTDDDLADIVDLVLGGIHPPEVQPFSLGWTDAAPADLARQTLRFNWQARVEWSSDAWDAVFAVARDGTVVGVQGLHGQRVRERRSVTTGSWLGRQHQGHGIGRRMRTAVLAFAFDHLGVDEARSGAFLDNEASARVSRALGYVEDGTERHAPRGTPVVEQRFVLTRAAWGAVERPAVAVSGFDACRTWFLGEDDGDAPGDAR